MGGCWYGGGRGGGKGDGDSACLRMVGMEGFPAQGNSYKIGGLLTVSVFWH